MGLHPPVALDDVTPNLKRTEEEKEQGQSPNIWAWGEKNIRAGKINYEDSKEVRNLYPLDCSVDL